MYSTNRFRAVIYFSPIWNEPATSFQHRAAAVFPCGKGGETCSFPHRKKLLLAGAPGANSPSLAALDRFPFLSLRDIFPRPGEVVLKDGAFGIAGKFPAKVQSLRARQRLPPRGSCQNRQVLTEGVCTPHKKQSRAARGLSDLFLRIGFIPASALYQRTRCRRRRGRCGCR